MNFMFIRARYNYIQLIILQRIEGKARFLYSLPFPPSSNGMNGMKWYAVMLILFEWIRIEWIRTGGIRVEDTYWWDMYWWDTFAIPADAHLLNGYVCNGYVLVGYVWNGYVWNGYVWDMYDVLDMYGILVVIGGIRITTFWMDTHCMDTYWWDTYGWDTFGMDMCGICAMCWICVGYVWWIRLEWICVGYVWCAGYVWDMCGVRYANNLLKNPATKRLSGKKKQKPKSSDAVTQTSPQLASETHVWSLGLLFFQHSEVSSFKYSSSVVFISCLLWSLAVRTSPFNPSGAGLQGNDKLIYFMYSTDGIECVMEWNVMQ